MIKHVFLFILTLVSAIAFAQDYRCVNEDASCYFTDGANYKVIAIDSLVSHADTLIYYNYPTLAESDDPACFTKNGPSWVGRKIAVSTNGDHVFYNFENRAVLIKTLAETGDSWNCYGFDNGNYISASIQSVEEMSFLGISEDVKRISFQVYDTLDNPIVHQINEMYLLLSRNHGLIRTVNFNVFPDLVNYFEDVCHEFELSGILGLEPGTTNLSDEQIFDFAIGDEIHTHQYYSSWYSGNTTGYSFQFIKKIVDKQILADGAVVYSTSRCGRREYFSQDSKKLRDTLYLHRDTIVDTLYLGNPKAELNHLPDELISVVASEDSSIFEYKWYNQTLDAATGRLRKTLVDGYYSFYPHTCIEEIIVDEKFDNGYFYSEGLGGPYWDYNDWWNENFNQVTYFKKGDEEWGEPFICDSLLLGLDEFGNSDPIVFIAPNPMKRWARVSLSNPGQTSYVFHLFNMMGMQVVEKVFHSDEFLLQKDGLPSGIYFYIIEDNGSFRKSGKLIMQ